MREGGRREEVREGGREGERRGGEGGRREEEVIGNLLSQFR